MYLYCIATRDGELCKIGYSREPNRRLSAFRTGNSNDLYLAHVIAVPQDRGRYYESLLHKEIAHLRDRREWYRCRVETIISLMDWFSIHYLSD